MIVRLILLLIVPSGVLAQAAKTPDLAAGIAIWPLDRGTASASATMLTVFSLGLGWRLSPGFSAQVELAHAPEGRIDPGVSAVEGFVRIETPRPSERVGVFVGLGASLFHWQADNNEQVRMSCSLAPTCFFEGIGYETGKEYGLSLWLGARVPLLNKVALEPFVGAALPIGDEKGGRIGERTSHRRIGIAAAWRP